MALWRNCGPAEPEYVAGDQSSRILNGERCCKDEEQGNACEGTAGRCGIEIEGKRSPCNKERGGGGHIT